MGGVAVILAFVAGTFGVQALQNAGDALFAKETAAQAEEIASTAEKVAENSMDVAATSDKRATQAQGTADAFEATSEALGGTATSNAATGVLKSRRLAMQLAPMGPRPGSSNFWP